MDLETEEVNMGEVLTGPYTSSVSPQPTVLEANDEARHQTACEVPQAEVSFMAPQPAYATDAEPLRNLIVNYLPPMMDETQLFQLFAQFGPIESVKIIYDKVTRESRGYGFVKYTFFFSATYAVHWLNGYHIAGKRLKVAFANAEAAYECYKAMSMSATMFSPPQQATMEGIFYRQMLMAQQQDGS